MLVGDYLFARAFQLMVETGSLRVLDILADASAVIAEGEVLQLTVAANLATDEATYLQVVRGKTAALFAAACEVGGVIAGAPEPQVAALRTYGDALGVAFQITDDLLDYGGLATALGKNVGDDFRERKITLPVIRAVAAADAGGARLLGARDRPRRAAARRPRGGAAADAAATARSPPPTPPRRRTPPAPGRRSPRCRTGRCARISTRSSASWSAGSPEPR